MAMIRDYWDIRGVSGGPPGRAGKCYAAGDRFAGNFVCGARCSRAPSLRLSFPGRGEGWEYGRGRGAQKVVRLNLMSVLCPGYLSQLAHAIRLLLEYTDSN